MSTFDMDAPKSTKFLLTARIEEQKQEFQTTKRPLKNTSCLQGYPSKPWNIGQTDGQILANQLKSINPSSSTGGQILFINNTAKVGRISMNFLALQGGAASLVHRVLISTGTGLASGSNSSEFLKPLSVHSHKATNLRHIHVDRPKYLS